MDQVSSIVALLVLLLLAFSPLVVARVRRREERLLPPVLEGRELVAYLLYVDHCRGDRDALDHYERWPEMREPWLREADRQMTDWKPYR